MAYGDATITIADGGSSSIIVPSASVQLVIGTATSGPVGSIVATRSPATLLSTFGPGQLAEAGALTCLAGGTVLAMRATTNTHGSVRGGTGQSVTAASNASPIVITVASTSGLSTGDVVTIAGVGGNTAANGTFDITVLTSTTFSLNGTTGTGAYTSGGTATWGGVTFTGTGTSVVSVTVDGTNGAFDEYYVQFLVQTGGIVGSTGITFQISLDAGRNFGPVIALGTATTYAIPNTGLTLNFAAGTFVANDTAKFSTIAPIWNDAGIQACLNAAMASPYGGSGWGSTHIVGICAGSDASTFGGASTGYLEVLATNYVFTRSFVSARDASPPIAWGGTGETEAAWMTALGTDYSAVSAKRICAGAGHYNMPSAFPNSAAGAPRYRRPIAWAAAARQVTAPAQRHIGRVRDGALGTVVVNPTTDPTDGFVYHDESLNPGLDYLTAGTGTNRFMTGRTRRPNLPGIYIANPLLAAPSGSDFFLMPLGSVMDLACGIVHQVGQQTINDDLRLTNSGTLYVNDALDIQNKMLATINANLSGKISGATVVVDQTVNVRSTKNVVITVTINARGYVLSETINIGFNNSAAAQPAAA